MRFVVLVEGHAEKLAAASFLKRWLDPRLNETIGVKTVNFRGKGNLIREIVTKADDYLDGPEAHEIVAVIGLLDLYALDIYPPEKVSTEERYDWAVGHFEQRVGRSKFRMFFAVHEFEAWIPESTQQSPAACQGRTAESRRTT